MSVYDILCDSMPMVDSLATLHKLTQLYRLKLDPGPGWKKMLWILNPGNCGKTVSKVKLSCFMNWTVCMYDWEFSLVAPLQGSELKDPMSVAELGARWLPPILAQCGDILKCMKANGCWWRQSAAACWLKVQDLHSVEWCGMYLLKR